MNSLLYHIIAVISIFEVHAKQSLYIEESEHVQSKYYALRNDISSSLGMVKYHSYLLVISCANILKISTKGSIGTRTKRTSNPSVPQVYQREMNVLKLKGD